jgi:hypothetical protein
MRTPKPQTEALLTKAEEQSLDSLDFGDIPHCIQTIGSFSPRQIVYYQEDPKRRIHLDYLLWYISKTWGFEVWWNRLFLMDPDERNRIIEAEGLEDLPNPEDLTPDLALKDHDIWDPEDRSGLRAIRTTKTLLS